MQLRLVFPSLLLAVTACNRSYNEVQSQPAPGPVALTFDVFYNSIGTCRANGGGTINLLGEFVVDYTAPQQPAASKVELLYGFSQLRDGRFSVEWSPAPEPMARTANGWQARIARQILTTGRPDRLQNMRFAIRITRPDGQVSYERGNDSSLGYFESEAIPERGGACTGFRPLRLGSVKNGELPLTRVSYHSWINSVGNCTSHGGTPNIIGEFVIEYQGPVLSSSDKLELHYGFTRVNRANGTTEAEWVNKNTIPFKAERQDGVPVARVAESLFSPGSSSALRSLQFVLKITDAQGAVRWEKGGQSPQGFFQASAPEQSNCSNYTPLAIETVAR